MIDANWKTGRKIKAAEKRERKRGWRTHILEYANLLVRPDKHFAILFEALMHDIRFSRTTFADGFHLKLHLPHDQ